ncbi:ccr4 associated factor [Friedmanniomyces endolithicus]|nr:ccr4 associated factor [Friedmanniomyces endolithicus]
MDTQQVPENHPEIDWSKWTPPGNGDVRSPCPAINSLANHGILPHNGKNITKAMANEALTKALHLDSHIANVFAAGAVAANPDHSAHSFDLNHVDKHGYIEHDVSLSRNDIAFGDNSTFSKAVFEPLLQTYEASATRQGSNDAVKTSWKTASEVRYARVKASKGKHDAEGGEWTYGLKESILSYGESALYLNLLGKDGVAPLESVRILFEEERLPYAEGWRPPPKFDQSMMNHAFVEMIKANEHKAEEAKLVGMGTVEALEAGITSMIKGLSPTSRGQQYHGFSQSNLACLPESAELHDVICEPQILPSIASGVSSSCPYERNLSMLARPAPLAPYTCARCLLNQQKRRAASTRTAPPPPPPPSGAARLANRRLISLHGEEAPKFLQGLITNNVTPRTQAGFYAAFLTAPGKVLHDVFIYPTLGSDWHKDAHASDEKGPEQPGYLVEVDGEEVGALMKHLKKHKLRSKFRMRVVEAEELGVWSLWREDERWTSHSQDSTTSDGMLGLTDARAPGMGQRLLIPSSSQDGSGVPARLEVDEAPLSAYALRRYLRGVPEGQKEIPRDESLPMNYNLDIMGGIDFKKGCYLGQELTIRTHHTGVVRRRVLPVVLYPPEAPAPERLAYNPGFSTVLSSGDNQELPAEDAATHHLDIKRDDKRKRATGKLIGRIGNVGLGLCRLEQMSDLAVSGEGSSFSPEDRFVVEDGQGGEVGLKAFVPGWIRGTVRSARVQKRVE